jgi:hypothetical protein
MFCIDTTRIRVLRVNDNQSFSRQNRIHKAFRPDRRVAIINISANSSADLHFLPQRFSTVTKFKSGAESYRIVMDKSGTPITYSLKRKFKK